MPVFLCLDAVESKPAAFISFIRIVNRLSSLSLINESLFYDSNKLNL